MGGCSKVFPIVLLFLFLLVPLSAAMTGRVLIEIAPVEEIDVEPAMLLAEEEENIFVPMTGMVAGRETLTARSESASYVPLFLMIMLSILVYVNIKMLTKKVSTS